MPISIKYPKQFSKEYKDFIIVLSKLSELKNIKNLPFVANSLTESRELEKSIPIKVTDIIMIRIVLIIQIL